MSDHQARTLGSGLGGACGCNRLSRSLKFTLVGERLPCTSAPTELTRLRALLRRPTETDRGSRAGEVDVDAGTEEETDVKAGGTSERPEVGAVGFTLCIANDACVGACKEADTAGFAFLPPFFFFGTLPAAGAAEGKDVDRMGNS
jgi:hypothetical protein